MSITRFFLEVQPNLPAGLQRLRELADDLQYTWDRQVRGLFFRLDRELWEASGHNPKVFLRRVSQARLEEAVEDPVFMEDYNRVLSAYDSYHQQSMRSSIRALLDPKADLIAYFCAEFGFHESVPLYSGGLGILAGDHCKAASDLGLPFVAVGMLYRQGYFTQAIDAHGKQVTHYVPTDFADLPVSESQDANAKALRVHVQLPGRQIALRVWRAKAGQIALYLLDSDLPENSDADRKITYQLYGGDINTRMQQDIVLGIGGVRALRALGLKPTIWHINEGHGAFQILERCYEHVHAGLPFDGALELVAAGTVFTTHTPVAAGHDVFEHGLFRSYFEKYAHELGIGIEQLTELGASPNNQNSFNMTALALRGSRFHNAVSRIHQRVASRMEGHVWAEVPPEENPIGYVSNGVHVPTFLARDWVHLFDVRFDREWRNQLLNEKYWQRIDEIPDQSFWSVRQALKSRLLEDVRRRAVQQLRRNGCSEALIERLTRYLDANQTGMLTIGFARRVATYKRATLIFSDARRLARLLNDPSRPALLIFAGKAHPHDLPSQALIQRIHEYARSPEFEGRIILLENYDLALARSLVAGVDVWLNNPLHPLEASGTSGQKAGINGVLNLSVLDGWWDEGYNGANGWAITPHGPDYEPAARDRDEAQALLDLLEYEVIPMYYDRNGQGLSEQWVRRCKASMQSILPRFNSQRMVRDYTERYYVTAKRQHLLLAENAGAPARELAAWKRHVAALWPKVRLRRLDEARSAIRSGEMLSIELAARLNGLQPSDVRVECLVGRKAEHGEFRVEERLALQSAGAVNDDEQLFRLELRPRLAGLQFYELRAYPYHPLLSHPFETGLMVWL